MKLQEQIKKILKEETESSGIPDGRSNLSSKDRSLLKMIRDLENGEIDGDFIGNIFGGIDSFFKILAKRGLLDYIDPFANWPDRFVSTIHLAFLRQDSGFIYELVSFYFNDIIGTSDGEFYVNADYDDLARLFETSSDFTDEDIATILSGEPLNGFDLSNYDMDSIDVYNSIPLEYQKIVDDRIRLELKSIKKLESSTKTPIDLDMIIQKHGGNKEIVLTPEIIEELFQWDDIISYLITNIFPEIGNDLHTLGEDCLMNELYSEWSKSLWSDLTKYVIDETKPIFVKGGGQMYFKCTNALRRQVSAWLVGNEGSEDTMGNYGRYFEMLDDYFEYGPGYLDTNSLNVEPNFRNIDDCILLNLTKYF
jgi:hypothetical protein